MRGRGQERIGAVLRSPAAAAGALAAAALLLTAVFGPVFLGDVAGRIDLDLILQGATPAHPAGTDELGRDLLARVITATRLSLGLSVLATLVGAAVGVVLGALPAITPNWVGKIIASVINLALAFPALLLTLFVAAVMGPGVRSATLAIALALAPIFARLAQTLSAGIKNADYIQAARLLGVKPHVILLRHVLPNIAGPLLVTMVMGVSGAVIVLSGLSFLGVGVQAPLYDWGLLLNQGLNRIYVGPAPALAPAVAIVLAGVGLSLFGETLAVLLGLRDGEGPPRRADAVRNASAEAVAAPAAEDALLIVDDLRVAAQSGKAPVPIVRGVSLRLRSGERVGLVGESGSGKTMTALAIAQLLDGRARASAARLVFDGRTLVGPGAVGARERGALLGGSLPVIFQDPLGSFNPLLKVGVQLAEVGVQHGGLSRNAAHARATQKISAVGLDEPERRARQHAHELSGGMLQRCMIAMALMLRPRLLIADEPTTALDVTVQKQVLELLDRACAETDAGLLLISHDLAVVAQTCDRVLVMYAGRIVEDLPAAQLARGAAHPYTHALLASTLDLEADRGRPLPALTGRAPAPGEVAAGCPFASRCTRVEPRCAADEPELVGLADGHSVACWRPHHAGGALQ